MRYSIIRWQLIFIQSLSVRLGVVSLYLCVLRIQLCLVAMALVNLYYCLALTEAPTYVGKLSFTESIRVYYKKKKIDYGIFFPPLSLLFFSFFPPACCGYNGWRMVYFVVLYRFPS